MDLTNKKLLILGGGQAQIELIKTARSMGIQTIVVGLRGNYPGYEIADKVYNVDLLDKMAVLKIAIEQNINGACMVCSDIGLDTLGFICDKLHLTGITEKSALLSANKLSMKKKLIEHNITTAKYTLVSNMNDVERIRYNLHLPLMVKATDLQGSKGIFKCDNYDDLKEYCRKAIKLSNEDYCIVEEYIDGEEFGAQAFIYDGNIMFILPHGDIVYRDKDTSVPIGHYMPYRDNNESLKYSIFSCVEKSVKALGLNNCAVNIDFIIKDNVPYVLELTGRAGANFLPELTGTYLGLNYYKLIIIMALGFSPNVYFESRKQKYGAVVSRQIYSHKSGIVKDIHIKYNNKINIISLFIGKGDMINQFRSSSDCIGKVLCAGNSLNECECSITDFFNNDITIEIQDNDTI